MCRKEPPFTSLETEASSHKAEMPETEAMEAMVARVINIEAHGQVKITTGITRCLRDIVLAEEVAAEPAAAEPEPESVEPEEMAEPEEMEAIEVLDKVIDTTEPPEMTVLTETMEPHAAQSAQ